MANGEWSMSEGVAEVVRPDDFSLLPALTIDHCPFLETES
jgi:hypothetical protein